ncbi:MAG: (Fe-S)-binding protein [Deltaproteobacteria bacterium]|nr:MAG: (Fe-S)-binding protein [Deltaproteobacteria bacterium]
MYSKMLMLKFPKKRVGEPIVVNLVKEFDLTFNILKATIYPRKEGVMVMELSGNRRNFQKGLKYLKNLGIQVETVAQEVKKDEGICIHCGMCTAVCPTGALYIKRPEMEVIFDNEKCSACELCIIICPVKAMKLRFDKNKL